MDYNKIETVLKRFSFEEKMRIAQEHSCQAMTSTGIAEFNKLFRQLLPWELETFLLFSICSNEWNSDSFSGKNKYQFRDIMNAIRQHISPELLSVLGSDPTDWILPVTAATQFEIQESFSFKAFRYNYYFSFCNERINMPRLFEEMFGCKFSDYLLLGQLLWIHFANNHSLQAIYPAIMKHFSVPITQLTLERQEFIREIGKFANSCEQYLYCLRPSYSYPFISYNGHTYCPLPHLLHRATTTSLMHRLTNDNEVLMRLVGKEVYESYLYRIIKDSGLFDEVISEQTYYIGRNKKETVDVMARRKNDILFFDSKSFRPKSAIRNFSQTAFDSDILRLSNSVVQMYRHIRNRFPSEYCYFTKKPPQIDSIFGLVVVQEDAYIRSHAIYKKAAELLGIAETSEDYNWLYSHVGIVSIYAIERYCFTKTDMFPCLKDMCKRDNISDSWLSGDIISPATYPGFLTFYDQHLADIQKNIIGLCEPLSSNETHSNPNTDMPFK